MNQKNGDKNISIEIMKDGPLIVKGLTCFTDSDDNLVNHEKAVFALCRCGESANKPYCDGAHTTAGFSGDREIKRPLDKSRAYTGKQITIHDNRTICAHAAECVNNLSSVFQPENRPWINPDGAPVDEIINVIKKCPSGALSYTLDEVHHTPEDLEPGISVKKDGPYDVTGKVDLKADGDILPPNKELFSLCRCGVSKNKPFCDGTHHEIGFKDN